MQNWEQMKIPPAGSGMSEDRPNPTGGRLFIACLSALQLLMLDSGTWPSRGLLAASTAIRNVDLSTLWTSGGPCAVRLEVLTDGDANPLFPVVRDACPFLGGGHRLASSRLAACARASWAPAGMGPPSGVLWWYSAARGEHCFSAPPQRGEFMVTTSSDYVTIIYQIISNVNSFLVNMLK